MLCCYAVGGLGCLICGLLAIARCLGVNDEGFQERWDVHQMRYRIGHFIAPPCLVAGDSAQTDAKTCGPFPVVFAQRTEGFLEMLQVHVLLWRYATYGLFLRPIIRRLRRIVNSNYDVFVYQK